MQGQANHFESTLPARCGNQKPKRRNVFTDLNSPIVSSFGDHPYALKRYVNETRRLYRTMDTALAKNPSGYLVGDHLSIADIAIWPWTTAYSRFFRVPHAPCPLTIDTWSPFTNLLSAQEADMNRIRRVQWSLPD